MCSSPEPAFHRWRLGWLAIGLAGLLLAGVSVAQTASSKTRPAAARNIEKTDGIGRTATAKEVAAWDIDVRPDFKGLPQGAGSVAQGQHIWEAKCASCHGVFGESNEIFSPLVGGTTLQDIQSGQVASLKDNSFPGRTTLMKLATVSTLWDYINRAMPWNAPKTLSADEVYAVTAFVLNLGGIVPDDFTLSDATFAQVQARPPNRAGMSTAHALWPGSEFGAKKTGQVRVKVCLNNCSAEPQVTSQIPAYARNAHGNLAEQNRLVGAQLGVDTTQAALASGATYAAAQVAQRGQATLATGASTGASTNASAASNSNTPGNTASNAADNTAAIAVAHKHSCTACHGLTQKLVGPAFNEIAKKHAGRVDYLLEKIVKGSVGVWGPIPMPQQSIPEADARRVAQWLANGAQK